jgi:hypothetical protein
MVQLHEDQMDPHMDFMIDFMKQDLKKATAMVAH